MSRLPLAIIIAGLAGCSLAARTGIIRKDVLTDAQQVIEAMEINHGALTIAGAVDREDTTYAAGQKIALSVTVDKDAFVAILRTLPDGSTTILFPNKAHPDGAAAANKTLTVPGADDTVTIAAGKPGIELFEFIGSTQGTSWLFKRAPQAGEDFAKLGVTTRTIAKDALSSLNIGKGPETAATYLTIRVR